MKMILASGSPRRQGMFRDLGIRFKVVVPQIDEGVRPREAPLRYVRRLANQKCLASIDRSRAWKRSGSWAILAADTIVVLDGEILGKPSDAADARRMLGKLSGKTHEVITAYCWCVRKAGGAPKLQVGYVRTKVSFAKRSPRFWAWYVRTGEPMDKAGAYAAQGIGVSFIKEVRGSYSNVIGLPLPQVLRAFFELSGRELVDVCR